ncbi:MAG: hypothetical protein P3W90_005250, partial [Paracoccus sp. (in: a-proteobacteria)]|nr:hypothetical protein [Paracoccus sp. (in: a-proteobacteria)]
MVHLFRLAPGLALAAGFALPLAAQVPPETQAEVRAALDRAVATLKDDAPDRARQRIDTALETLVKRGAEVAALATGPLPSLDRLIEARIALDQAALDLSRSAEGLYAAADVVSNATTALMQAEELLAPPSEEAAPPGLPAESPDMLPRDTSPPDLALSQEIAAKGIAATEARLAAVVEPPPEDRFALAGLRFLGAVEAVLQARWRVGLSEEISDLPFLRLPIADNPAPEPLDAGLIRDTLRATLPRLAAARAPLDGLDDDFGLDIALGDLWFDVNANGSRDPGEDLAQIAGALIGSGPALPVVRFDTADAAWLAAYTHMLAGFSQVVLAYDPTASNQKTMDTRAALAQFPRSEPGMVDMIGEPWLDTVTVVLDALRREPDAAMSAAARDSFLAMIAQNRLFWERVAAETDNHREWIPNARQESALGVTLPPETGPVWLEVLADAEAALNGTKLIPYWRSAGGVNLGRMFTEARPVDLLDWISGAGAAPYLESGEMVTVESSDRFNTL